jgi:nucleoside-diphosphate-sugar epimerase
MNYLVLGHKGFLGNLIAHKITDAGVEVRVINQRITDANAKEIFLEKIDKDTIVFNCIGSGVTPGMGNDLDDLSTNQTLLQNLLEVFVTSKGKLFIHFGSNYETKKPELTVSSRSTYIASKQGGSRVCRSFIIKDRRIHLIYLPTVIAATQPKGRFLADFVNAHQTGSDFIISYPAMTIEMVSFASLWEFLECMNLQVASSQLHFSPIDAFLSVNEFAETLNEILEEINLEPVRLSFSDIAYAGERALSESHISDKFKILLKSYLTEMIRR